MGGGKAAGGRPSKLPHAPLFALRRGGTPGSPEGEQGGCWGKRVGGKRGHIEPSPTLHPTLSEVAAILYELQYQSYFIIIARPPTGNEESAMD